MDDLISRQAAIDALGEKPLAWTEGEYELGLQNQWQSDVDALKALPSAQPEQKWIPCSERLPEKFQTCIVTDELRQCTYEYDYDPKNEFTKKYGWRYNGRQIIAWMPLPEPYKGCENDLARHTAILRMDEQRMKVWFKGAKPIEWMPHREERTEE